MNDEQTEQIDEKALLEAWDKVMADPAMHPTVECIMADLDHIAEEMPGVPRHHVASLVTMAWAKSRGLAPSSPIGQ